MGDFAKNLIKDILVAAVLAAVVLTFIRPTIVKQTSMQNTLQPNDYMIMNRRAYTGDRTPERGDIVIFQSSMLDEKGREKLLIKRVIGLPGDTVEIKDDQLYINGEAYEEDYLKDGITTPWDMTGPVTVPDDKYFCMGDNRVDSVDSRCEEVGLVDGGALKGKVVLRLFPFNKIQRF